MGAIYLPNMKLLNPYLLDETQVVHFPVSKKDQEYLNSLCLEHGVQTAVLSILFQKLCQSLQTHDFKSHTQSEDFKRFILGCRIQEGPKSVGGGVASLSNGPSRRASGRGTTRKDGGTRTASTRQSVERKETETR